MSSHVESHESDIVDESKVLEFSYPYRYTFLPVIKEYLEVNGYNENVIVVRFFEPERLHTALKTGTDRDSGSYQWFDTTPNDGVLPETDEVFYGFTWQFRDDYKELAFEVDTDGSLTNVYIDFPDYFHACIAIYDVNKVERKGKFEYQFIKGQNKKEALLAAAIL